MAELTGKAALVTGAARGIGRAVAEVFVREGAAVMIADRLGAEGEATAAALCAQGGQVAFVQGDVRHDAEAMVAATVAAFGRLDILVNNAGIFYNADALNIPFEEWVRAVDVIFYGTFHCSRAAARVMVEQGEGGHIVNVSSVNTPRHGAIEPLQCCQRRGRSAHALPGSGMGALWHPGQQRGTRLCGHADVNRERCE